MKYGSFFIVLVLGIVFFANQSKAISLDEFLLKVKESSSKISASQERAKAAQSEYDASDMPTASVLDFSVSRFSDKRAEMFSAPRYDEQSGNSYAVGISKQTSFGTQFKISVEATQAEMKNFKPFAAPLPTAAGAADLPGSNVDATIISPKIEIKQPLWKDGFGRSIRLARNASESGRLATELQSQMTKRDVELEARISYARLAHAKENAASAEKSLQTAQRTYDFVREKVSKNLYDQSNMLQAAALLSARKVEREAAQIELSNAALEFNNLLGDSSDEKIAEVSTLAELIQEGVYKQELAVEERMELKALSAQSSAQQFVAELEEDKARPSLDLFGSYELQGQDDSFSGAYQNVNDPYQPKSAVGLKLSMFVDRKLANSAAQAARAKKIAADAELEHAKKMFNMQLNALRASRDGALRSLKIARELATIQKDKLENENREFRNGKSTTYQVLMFSQDLVNAEQGQSKAAFELYKIDAQLTLFAKK